MSTKMRGIVETIVCWVLVIALGIGCIALVNHGINEWKNRAIEMEEYRMRKAERREMLDQTADILIDWCSAYYAATYCAEQPAESN